MNNATMYFVKPFVKKGRNQNKLCILDYVQIIDASCKDK